MGKWPTEEEQGNYLSCIIYVNDIRKELEYLDFIFRMTKNMSPNVESYIKLCKKHIPVGWTKLNEKRVLVLTERLNEFYIEEVAMVVGNANGPLE